MSELECLAVAVSVLSEIICSLKAPSALADIILTWQVVGGVVSKGVCALLLIVHAGMTQIMTHPIPATA